MILDTILGNLRPWTEQVIVIATVSALLPALIRLRHPRTQLAYCHLMLAGCLLLPFLQPWRHAIIVIEESRAAADEPTISNAALPTLGARSVTPVLPST